MSTLEERLQGGSSTPWIPDPAKAEKYDKDSVGTNPLIGIFVDHFTLPNYRNDGFYDVVVLHVEGVGDVAVHCQATVLANQMRQARPVFGEKVGVNYLGERVGASATYSDYKVAVDRSAGGQVQWADAEERTDTPAPAPAPAAAAPAESFTPAPAPATPPSDDEIPF